MFGLVLLSSVLRQLYQHCSEPLESVVRLIALHGCRLLKMPTFMEDSTLTMETVYFSETIALPTCLLGFLIQKTNTDIITPLRRSNLKFAATNQYFGTTGARLTGFLYAVFSKKFSCICQTTEQFQVLYTVGQS